MAAQEEESDEPKANTRVTDDRHLRRAGGRQEGREDDLGGRRTDVIRTLAGRCGSRERPQRPFSFAPALAAQRASGPPGVGGEHDRQPCSVDRLIDRRPDRVAQRVLLRDRLRREARSHDKIDLDHITSPASTASPPARIPSIPFKNAYRQITGDERRGSALGRAPRRLAPRVSTHISVDLGSGALQPLHGSR